MTPGPTSLRRGSLLPIQVGRQFAEHGAVDHGQEEYVRGDPARHQSFSAAARLGDALGVKAQNGLTFGRDALVPPRCWAKPLEG
jgi:hypothetical protein